MQIDIVYAVMRLHNFIKLHLRNKKNIYFISIDILDDARSNSDIAIIQSSSI